MRKRYGIAFVGLLVAMSLAGPGTASAATEFGDNCVANEATATEPVTVFGVVASGNPLPLTSPVSGVMTQWKSVLVPAPVSIPQTLKVLRPAGPNLVQIIGEAPGSITGGVNTFNTRIPVQAGDRVALFGDPTSGNLVCRTTGVEQIIGGFVGPGGGVGTTVPHVVQETDARIPVTGVVEPDADNDGFGDETQDKCPQLATTQVACPTIAVNALTAIKRKGSVVVLLTTDNAAPVTVAGTVNLGKGKKAKLSSKAQTVVPGTVSRFTLKFPKRLKKRLQELARKRSLLLKVTASATNTIGQVTTDKLNVRLKGQAKG